jgi:CRISPR-associated protein Csm1
MKNERDIIYLAALLHDIGKFWQRADSSGVKSSYEIDQFHKRLESSICPTKDGLYTHKHVVWTAQFFETFKAIFEDNIDAFGKEAGTRKSIVRWAAAHHNPNPASLEECIVQLADHCSSGVDRTSQSGLEDETVEYEYEVSKGWDKFKDVRMKSIFENLLDNKTDAYKLPITEIELSKNFFPKYKFERSGQKEYADLWKKFADELSKIPKKDIRQLSDSILYLLEKYTVTIPSSTKHLPDVSLYEHSRSTAAYALCLYDFLSDAKNKGRFPKDIKADEEPFLLIGGDLSGIQAYIYDIVGKGAAKNLKGRSFYLQLIVEVIVQYLLDELNLYRSNIVYSSGGGFYILAPNTDEVAKKLPNLINTLTEKIRNRHGTKLYLAIDSEPIKKSVIFDGKLNTLWTELTKKLSEKKLNRFADYIASDEGYEFFFKPSDEGGRQQRDAVTGEEFEVGERKYPFSLDEENDEKVKKNTFEQIRLGKILRDKISFVVIAKSEIPYWENDHRFYGISTHKYFRPLDIGKFYYFLSENEIQGLKQRLTGSVDDATILKVNDTQLGDFILTGNRNVNGFTFYGGNDLPRTQDDEALYFDEMAGDESVSFKRLGILRMDVDRLGKIFKDGFKENRRTFSRYSSLSRSLDFFFKGYLNTIWQEDKFLKENTFILYAGGDDLFIVGKWDASLAFAQKIQSAFEEWTCQNPVMGISGGMALVGGRFPIAKAATQSDEEEKLAKGHVFSKKEKNALSFLQMPLAFGKELAMVEDLKKELVKYIQDESGIPKGFLGKISALHSMKTEQEKKGQNPSWRWISAYDIGRAIQRTKSNEAKQFFEKVKINLFTNKKMEGSDKYEYIDLLHFAARWAELEMRSKSSAHG